jgi:2'-5' RNA ligase
MKLIRTFISIDMPKNVKERIGEIQNNLPDFFGKKTEFENLHLTLKFLGEIDESKVEEVKKRLKDIKHQSFEAEIDDIGVFSEKFIRIIWVHLRGAEELQKKIDSVLQGLFEKERRFMSHITIARVKAVKGKRGEFLGEIKGMKIDKIRFRVENFTLKKSELFPEGPKYEIINEFKLEK